MMTSLLHMCAKTVQRIRHRRLAALALQLVYAMQGTRAPMVDPALNARAVPTNQAQGQVRVRTVLPIQLLQQEASRALTVSVMPDIPGPTEARVLNVWQTITKKAPGPKKPSEHAVHPSPAGSNPALHRQAKVNLHGMIPWFHHLHLRI